MNESMKTKAEDTEIKYNGFSTCTVGLNTTVSP